MATHRVYFEKGAQALITIPHRGGAPVRVSSGTYGIFDTRHSLDSSESVVVAAGTAATVDSASTTTTAKAGRNATDRRALTLTSSTGFTAGNTYILEHATSGQAELIKVAATASATVLRTVSEIRGDYPTGATLRGVQVTATFPSTPAADDDNLDLEPWVIVWAFSGLPPFRESIHLERGEEAQLATLADLLELDPTLSLVGGDRVDPAAALSRAHKDFRSDLRMAAVNEADLLTGPLGRDAVLYRAAALALQNADDEPSTRKVAEYKARYLELRTAIVVGAKKPEVTSLDRDTQTARASNPATLFYGFGARGRG